MLFAKFTRRPGTLYLTYLPRSADCRTLLRLHFSFLRSVCLRGMLLVNLGNLRSTIFTQWEWGGSRFAMPFCLSSSSLFDIVLTFCIR